MSLLLLTHHLFELLGRLLHTLSIIAVHHKDQTLRTNKHRQSEPGQMVPLMVLVLVLVLYLCVLEVVSPQRSDLVLTTNIPNCETDVLVLDRLNVEP